MKRFAPVVLVALLWASPVFGWSGEGHQAIGEAAQARLSAVAHAAGYRHLGLFNMMFKKRFGTTPGQWRRQHSGVERATKVSARRAVKPRG